MKKAEKLWKLFLVTLSVSATTSGGHAITAVLKPVFVEEYKWLSEEEFVDLISIGQTTPGSIAINVSVILGYRIAGLSGAFTAMLGPVIPPFFFMLMVTVFYEKIVSNLFVTYFMSGMQASVAALLLYVTVDTFLLNRKDCNLFGYGIMILSFVYATFTSLSLFYLFLFVIVAAFIRTIYVTRYIR